MFRGKEKGQTMAEFALILPVLILLLFGMTFAAFTLSVRHLGIVVCSSRALRLAHTASLRPNTPVTMFCVDLADQINAGQNGLRRGTFVFHGSVSET